MATLAVHRLGCVDYLPTFERMRALALDPAAPEALWLCEHRPVYTLGLAAKAEHVLDAGAIPVVQTDRGGQVTYHGPGQVVAYPLVDLRRLGIYVKEYVYRLEQAVIRTLETYGVTGHRVAGAPGVYVRIDDPFGHAPLDRRTPAERQAGAGAPSFDGLGKIAALGIKVGRHRAYHGVALNVAMDLGPFRGIDPCGYRGLETIDLSTIGVQVPVGDVAETLAAKLGAYLSA